jgi:hypothetical protein
MKSLFIVLAVAIAVPVISHPAWYLHDHGDSLEHTHDILTPDHTHH